MFFDIGDKVRARYMSDETIVGRVVAVDGDDVTVQYAWETIVHHGPALRHVAESATPEAITARVILADPSALSFIPDVSFANRLRATLAGSRRGGQSTTGLLSVGVKDSHVHVWTWSGGLATFTGARIAREARLVAGRNRRVVRVSHDVFTSVGAGVSSLTVYSMRDV